MKHWTYIDKTPASGLVYKHNVRNVTMIIYHNQIKLYRGVVSPFTEPLIRNKK